MIFLVLQLCTQMKLALSMLTGQLSSIKIGHEFGMVMEEALIKKMD